LKEIPKDIRSMNTSNFNKSSSRYHGDESATRQLQSNMILQEARASGLEDVSEQTLKTILDFKSERA